MGKKILVVDDDPMIRTLVKEILSAEGHEVDVAEDGSLGIQHLEKEPRPIKYELLILDVIMPGMNGLDVLTRLKLHPDTQNIPVLMLTGEDKAEDIMNGYNVGADYYITKPFTRQQLLFGLDNVLNS